MKLEISDILGFLIQASLVDFENRCGEDTVGKVGYWRECLLHMKADLVFEIQQKHFLDQEKQDLLSKRDSR